MLWLEFPRSKMYYELDNQNNYFEGAKLSLLNIRHEASKKDFTDPAKSLQVTFIMEDFARFLLMTVISQRRARSCKEEDQIFQEKN